MKKVTLELTDQEFFVLATALSSLLDNSYTKMIGASKVTVLHANINTKMFNALKRIYKKINS